MNDIQSSYCFLFCVFSIPKNVFPEHFEYSSRFFINQTGNTFYFASSCQSSCDGFHNTVEVIPQNFTISFCAPFPNPLPPLPRQIIVTCLLFHWQPTKNLTCSVVSSWLLQWFQMCTINNYYHIENVQVIKLFESNK